MTDAPCADECVGPFCNDCGRYSQRPAKKEKTVTTDIRDLIARAIAQADEQNGGPCWDHLMTLGKHVTGPVWDRADAILAALHERGIEIVPMQERYDRFDRAAYNAGLERAARICDANAVAVRMNPADDVQRWTAQNNAAAIRKEKDTDQ